MRVIVTGGTGFIGSALVRILVERGHEVAILSRRAQDVGGRRIRHIHGAIMSPPWAEIERFRPDVCVHCAWIATPGVYLEAEENLLWLEWSTQFLRRLPVCGVQNIVGVGTCLEYGAANGNLHESAALASPVSRYAQCKNELHLRLLSDPAFSQTCVTWARIFYPYGPGEPREKLVPWLVARLSAGLPCDLKMPFSIRDYIYVDDVAGALCLLAEKPFSGVVNVGTGVGISIGVMAEKIAELMSRQLPPFVGSGKSDQDRIVADVSRITGLGWKPRVLLAEGLARAVTACAAAR